MTTSLQLPQVAIIECGSQTTLLIEKRLRELKTRSIIVEPKKSLKWLSGNPVKLIILSGGQKSVSDADAPELSREILDLRRPDGSPVHVFGICYGHQWLAHVFEGKVVAERSEHGPSMLSLNEAGDSFLSNIPSSSPVWMNHGDSVITPPIGFTSYGVSTSGAIAAMGNGQGINSVQFHPEVTQTTHGPEMLANVLRNAGCSPDWEPASLGSEIQRAVKEEVGDSVAILPFSGGVDSSTAARILSPVFGKKLTGVTIDAGQFRENEIEEIKHNAKRAGIQHIIVDVKDAAADALSGLVDAEERRMTFKGVYFEALFSIARRLGARYIIQGSLAPDFIESGLTGGDNIKSHHNVGSDELIRQAGFIPLHPLSSLFKYEVRVLAREWGLPKAVSERQPSPGPGLYLRVLGGPSSPENIEVVRWATARTEEVLKKHRMYHTLAQLVVAYLIVPVTGIKGDKRSYQQRVIVRGVRTHDFMTVRGVHFSEKVQDALQAVLTVHPKINGVLFDPTDKPPGTTEFQ